MFDERTEADRAVDQLVQQLHINRDLITVHASETAASTGGTVVPIGAAAASEDRGFWGSLKDLFVPDEDRLTYAEGLRRGSVVVSAQVEESQMDAAMDVLEECGSIDLDTRENEWRESGWTGSEAVVASSPTMPGLGVAVAGAATTGAPQALDAGTEAIPIVEERLTVGKRDVKGGRVRVRSFIVETPVEEQVTLRKEHVDVQRRVVDRPVTDADRLFQDRTIEMTETSEEAVVAKDARVTEEVVIRKDASERVKTVRDTVRRTEVEVEDTTGKTRGTVQPGAKA